MPSINRIRVNNVKYNFGSQYYDDFTMRMHGKNTLYDLANGGGKSVLMLLLLQNMIPNCTLDEKQPIEKLFRTGNGNTTIHSLVEWKLDEGNTKEGYRYMTTGFCARKSKEKEEGAVSGAEDVASVEYFNYCIFYRDYNKNDIVNLPLVKDKERVTYQGLKNYLKELEHRDMSLMVRVFERKGEYQRFISEFGIHESQWEIIRGINKTEGHVRTYFETNYKTTRKVVEDLLIEEIIEKAFMVKTNRDENADESMAKMLMDIREQLTILSKKKKDIASFDHQIELVKLLSDKVSSFIALYQEQTALSEGLADICVTGEKLAAEAQSMLEQLSKRRDEKRSNRDIQKKKLECLKVERDRLTLESLKTQREIIEKKQAENKSRLVLLEDDLSLKESVNDYILYLEDKSKYQQYDALIRAQLSESSFDERLLAAYVYNIKMRMDILLTDLRAQLKNTEDEISEIKHKRDYNTRLLNEAKTELEVALSKRRIAEEENAVLSEKLVALRMEMSNISFDSVENQLEDKQNELKQISTKRHECDEELKETEGLLLREQNKLTVQNDELLADKRLISELSQKQQELSASKEKLDNIKTVYGQKDEKLLANHIEARITSAILEISSLKKQIKESEKRKKGLSEGIIIGRTPAVEKLLTYLETRHGINALTGMEYLSALPKDKRLDILEVNPELPYGIVVKEYDTIKNDPNITLVDTNNEVVRIFDMEAIDEKAMYYGENVILIHADAEYLVDEETTKKLITAEDEKIKELTMQCEIKEEMLLALRDDQAFVLRLTDSELNSITQKLSKAQQELEQLEISVQRSTELISSYKNTIKKLRAQDEELVKEYENCLFDINRLSSISLLQDMVAEKEAVIAEATKAQKRLEESINELSNVADDSDRGYGELEQRKRLLEKKQEAVLNEWNDKYKAYYRIDEEYEVLSYEDDELKARVTAMIAAAGEDAKAIDDKKLLMDTLSASMERTMKNIVKRGIDPERLKELERNNELFSSNDSILNRCQDSIDEAREQLEKLNTEYKSLSSSIDKLEGSIEYAISNIEASFGSFESYANGQADILAGLKDGEELLRRLDKELKECEAEYKEYSRQQGYMLDLYKDVRRIVTNHDISLDNATVLSENQDKLREIFEDKLIKYDRSTKSLDKAKNELVKFKGNTAQTLEQMEVYELAATIRNDVVVPEDYYQAKELNDNLEAIVDFIILERDRVQKSLEDMETIKQNFEEQCLQRCLDVKTELDKLPKLSRIMMEGEAISMVGLSIPYVKDEFLKQRMAEYIDKIVTQADDYNQDKDRIRFIRNSLALKKLFGVIVTDMNAIKLSLYKRERIKEQSRYLRYEEAVGSTGQSQGIYIQFLISIINYIAGMYQTGNEDIRTKTIFIDNPFGAAKDVYIWEPIFALLKANNVQLIVPARGATPAITGKFDVNYILGQQLSGGKQLTVVADYTSRVDQEELYYKDLEYEQVSFDFI